ncbi:MAG: hypothetical protein ACE5EX_06345, partial [Phycisphaerae bacterium]
MNPRRLSGRPRLPVVIVAICTLLPCAARAEFQTPIAITGATVVVEPGLTLESATVVIADGRIVAAGADVTVPPDAERIDGAGLIIYAGFIDGQTHLGIPKKVRSEKARKRTEDENPDPRQGPLPATRLANRRGIRPQFRALELYAPEEDQLKSNRAAGFTTA